MQYPIFNSIINTVETSLERKGIPTEMFKTWENSKINATGLELEIDLREVSDFMSKLSINFDWDSFREVCLARNLKGMETHPLLDNEHFKQANIIPTIDVETTWHFNSESCQPIQADAHGNYRLENASVWMESISKRVNQLLAKDDIITRWHVEIEGDENGKYLSAINLISYFQYEITELSSLNEVNTFVARRLQNLLYKSNKVINISTDLLNNSIAA